MPSLESIRYKRGELQILNQRLLPMTSEYIFIRTVEDAWEAIKSMKVRGAPAIAIVACLSLAVDLSAREVKTTAELQKRANEVMEYLMTSRPTAVNLQDATIKVKKLMEAAVASGEDIVKEKEKFISWLEHQLEADVAMNRRLGDHCADRVLQLSRDKPVTVLTICNTGSLATAGYGTALGVARSLHARGRLRRLFACETRPCNQGSRLTAFEMVHDGLPGVLIADSMAAAAMATQEVDVVIVGADRIVSNGDFANKIGTYQLAIAARHHNIPFFVVAPSTSFDFRLSTGKEIVIEERSEDELTCVGGQRIAAPGVVVWNPAFDVTPAELVTGGVVSEFGVFTPGQLESKMKPQLSI